MSTDTDRIRQLHEAASEHYLNGDYQGALQAWRDVLGLAPEDEQALDGMRMAAQFVEPAAPAPSAEATQVEQELDEGLKILDGVGVPSGQFPDRAEQTIDRQPDRGLEEAPVAEEIPEGWEPPPEPITPVDSFGLEPLARPAPAPGAPAGAAAAELKRRVADLLSEAKAKADAGERDEALSILARLGILDEDNAEAESLRLAIEAAGASDLDKVEQAIIEGVSALESDRLDDAERYFREALALAPEHREALHYLEKVAQKRTSGGEDLLGGLAGESAPTDDAVQRATVAPEPPPKLATPTKAQRSAPLPELPDAPLAAGRPRMSLPAPKLLIAIGLGAVVVIGAAMALPRLFGRSTPKFTAPNPAATAPRPAKPAAMPGEAAKPSVPTRVVPTDPAELAKAVASGLAIGQSRMDSGDSAGAILAFNDVLVLDPGNPEAKAGITSAGEEYKATKAERDALNTIKSAFHDQEFSSGLRLAYRLPPTVSKSYIDGIKVAGWYNLAVVALRAGDCREAQSHLDEALGIAPSDEDAKKLRDLASRYAEAVKDRAFLDRVEALSFRPLPAS